MEHPAPQRRWKEYDWSQTERSFLQNAMYLFSRYNKATIDGNSSRKYLIDLVDGTCSQPYGPKGGCS